MKINTLVLSLVFTVTLSSPSYSEWVKTGKNVHGDTFYVDFEKIRKKDEYVYWWDIVNYLKPDQTGVLSVEVHHQGDCKLLRYKDLEFILHKKPMGVGTGERFTPPNKWHDVPRHSTAEKVLKRVCNH